MAVAELLQAPVATTVSGKGVIPDDHPLAVGWGYGSLRHEGGRAGLQARSTRVLAIGARYSEVSTANYAVPTHEHLIHVDVDPNVLGRNVPASVKVHADARLFLARLLADGDRRPPPGRPGARRGPSAATARPSGPSIDEVQVKEGVDPMRFLALLGAGDGPGGSDVRRRDGLDPLGGRGDPLARPRGATSPRPTTRAWAGPSPAAIGGQRTRPDLPVACVTGDGCFLMSGLEASTAARAHLPVKFFVLDDGTYHYMQMLQEPLYGRTTATELAPPQLRRAGRRHGPGLR